MSLIDYPNTTKVVLQLQSGWPQEKKSEIKDIAHQLTLTQMSVDGKSQKKKQSEKTIIYITRCNKIIQAYNCRCHFFNKLLNSVDLDDFSLVK